MGLTPDVAVGDTVYLGEHVEYDSATAYTVTRVVSELSSQDGVTVTAGNQGFMVTPRAQVTLPFGSALYKVSNYNLWDANKVAGCVCDDGFTGYDCSSLACPVGADPLDVIGEDKEDSHSSTSTTNPSTYTKQNERQMLTMDSSRGALSGPFTLTFTSMNGEKKTTRSISTAPELSSTVSVSGVEEYDTIHCQQQYHANYGTSTNAWAGARCEKLIRFTPDLPDDELALNDYIRIGSEIRQVTKLTRSATSGNYSSAMVSAQFNQGYAPGTYAYRHSAAKAIEYGLGHLSNNVVGEVTATKSMSSGQLLFSNERTAAAPNTAKIFVHLAANNAVTFKDTGATGSKGPAAGSAGVGDNFRIHGHSGMSQIESIAGCDDSIITQLNLDAGFLATTNDDGTLGDANSRTAGGDSEVYSLDHVGIIDNGFKYKVQFVENSGDIPEMVCNTDNLRSVYRMDEAAYVSRDEPDRVWFVDTTAGNAQPSYKAVEHADTTHPRAISGGDTIFVGDQRCDVVSSDAEATVGLAARASSMEEYRSGSVVCAQALSENAHSTADAIVTHDPIEVLLGGATQSCSATDRPVLRFINDHGTQAASQFCADSSACADVLPYNGANRLVRWASGNDDTHESANEPMDSGDIAPNDRVSLRMHDLHTYETRTVDFVSFGGADGTNFFTVSQPFSAAHRQKRIHLNYKGTTSSAACSGRGLCDGSSAECQCFKGYTGQACQIQNALAA